MKVAITRLKEKNENGSSAKIFDQFGYSVLLVPTIKSVEPKDTSSLDQLISLTEKNEIDYLLFTSSLGVQYFFKRCRHLSKNVQILCVGPKTAIKVQEYGYNTDTLPSYASEHFARYLEGKIDGKNIGIARANVPNKRLITSLESMGGNVFEGICYELIPINHNLEKMINNKEIDAVVFTSSKSFQCLDISNIDLKSIITVSIGPKTANTMISKGFSPDIIGNGTLESCATALNDYDISKA
ncbi:uroporphyrinogen-III synthase [Methanosalsum natronophilum]|uniref:uroporphyrinogen-III synthase n=1 Tax=Methanosalsum natronophilum TaxID=768733 RepID=UPI0021683596|nr:uroporphyrinogen-III synthase [Methanosalsum natronophilum]MCS3924386.1 uroporphyrinogen-III synthase [Methanosalsum natronophilum]